jgi:acyl carrier protein
MSDDLDDLVLDVVARHVPVSAAALNPTQHIREDLDLDPLDLVLIALRLEDIVQVEFPIAALETIQTVGDFAVVLRGLPRKLEAPWTMPSPQVHGRRIRHRARPRPHP